MKINNQIVNNSTIALDSKVCACGDLMEPLKPLLGEQSPGATLDLSLYSKKGFIKGVEVLNKVKNLKYGFSTRQFGNMAFKFGEVEEVVKHRRGFIKAAGMNIKNAVFMLPNHGKGIDVVDSSHKGRGAFAPGTSVGPADALITFEKGIALGLNSADCVPLIITTKKADVLALVHAGRIGTDAKIARTTIKKLISLGVKVEDLIVGIGPAIQKSCYKLQYLETDNPYQWLPWIRPVLKSVKVLVEENKELGKQYKIRAEKGKILVDIIGFNIQQLLDIGVKSENIDVTPVCALCLARKGEIYSHFLSSQNGKSKLFPEGRFMSIAQLS
jgi:polyphenol oxidase